MPTCSIFMPDTAFTEIGTSCRLAVRLVAVTMISSSWICARAAGARVAMIEAQSKERRNGAFMACLPQVSCSWFVRLQTIRY